MMSKKRADTSQRPRRFLSGVARSADFFGVLSRRYPKEPQSASASLYQDWRRVGGDLFQAIWTYRPPQEHRQLELFE
jgi:hypothetical protein